MEIDEGFQPHRDIRVDLSGPAAPSLDGGFMLIGPAREFGSAPAEDDQAAFKAIGGHVSILNTFDRFAATETGWSVTMVRFGEVWQMLAPFFAVRRGNNRSYYATNVRPGLRSTIGAAKLAGLRF